MFHEYLFFIYNKFDMVDKTHNNICMWLIYANETTQGIKSIFLILSFSFY